MSQPLGPNSKLVDQVSVLEFELFSDVNFCMFQLISIVGGHEPFPVVGFKIEAL